MVKLVYTNPNAAANQSRPEQDTLPEPNTSKVAGLSRPTCSYETIMNSFLPHFDADVRFRGFPFYAMAARDLHHHLSCDLPLEVRETEDESEFGDVICQFPAVQYELLERVTCEDDDLTVFIMTHFHLKILNQLVRFCADRNARKLVIHLDRFTAVPRAAYAPLTIHTDEVITHQGRKTEIVIPTDEETYQKLLALMEWHATTFRAMLWVEKDNNPAIQQYLRLHASLPM